MRKPFALAAILAGFMVVGAVASAQAVPSAPDAIVSVQRDRLGGDLVRVGMRSAGYPPELLQQQLVELGRRLGRPSRSVAISAEPFRSGDASTTLVKGVCGVDGLIDRTQGRLNVAPIAQAFAGAPKPYTIHRMIVSFDGEVPGKRTLQRASNHDLVFNARLVGSSVEYDVELLSQDPEKLIVDEGDGSAVHPKTVKKTGVEPFTIALLSVAVLAAGALVYCLLVMLGRRPTARS